MFLVENSSSSVPPLKGGFRGCTITMRQSTTYAPRVLERSRSGPMILPTVGIILLKGHCSDR